MSVIERVDGRCPIKRMDGCEAKEEENESIAGQNEVEKITEYRVSSFELYNAF